MTTYYVVVGRSLNHEPWTEEYWLPAKYDVNKYADEEVDTQQYTDRKMAVEYFNRWSELNKDEFVYYFVTITEEELS